MSNQDYNRQQIEQWKSNFDRLQDQQLLEQSKLLLQQQKESEDYKKGQELIDSLRLQADPAIKIEPLSQNVINNQPAPLQTPSAENLAEIRLLKSRYRRDRRIIEKQLQQDRQKQPTYYNGYNAIQGGDRRVTNGYLTNGQRIVSRAGFIDQMPARKQPVTSKTKSQKPVVPLVGREGFLLIPDSNSFVDGTFNQLYYNILKWFCGNKKKKIVSFKGGIGFEYDIGTGYEEYGINYAINKLKLQKEIIELPPLNENSAQEFLDALVNIKDFVFMPCFESSSYNNYRIGEGNELLTPEVRNELKRIAKNYGLLVSGEWAYKNDPSLWYYVNKDWLTTFEVSDRVDCYLDYQAVFFTNLFWRVEDVSNYPSITTIYSENNVSPINLRQLDNIKPTVNFKSMIGTDTYQMFSPFIGMFQSVPNTEGIKDDEIVATDSTSLLASVVPENIVNQYKLNQDRCRIFYLSPSKITYTPQP